MILVVLALSVGVVAGFRLGLRYASARTEHQPVAHEALARVYQMPARRTILAELRGPLRGRP